MRLSRALVRRTYVKPVPDMTRDLIGKLFGDRGYISQKLFE